MMLYPSSNIEIDECRSRRLASLRQMFERCRLWLLAIAVALFISWNPAKLFAQSSTVIQKSSVWQSPAVQTIKSRAFEIIDNYSVDKSLRVKAEKLWSIINDKSPEEDILAAAAGTFALVEPNAERLVVLCNQPRSSLQLPKQVWLDDPQIPPFMADNMRLFYARWLVQESLYEEAKEQLISLDATRVVAPSSLLFYQSVVYHKLLEKESGLKTIEQLLKGPDTSPRRYLAVARLMQDDLEELEEDSLDHVSRRMDDVRRRLELGRAGPKVRKVEDGVIESLDKIIKKIEEQQQQMQSNSGGGTLRPRSPAQDSVPMGGKGPGDVNKRDIGSKSDWGNLPPQQREEALQQIGRDFPSHYRDAIEQYFKRLASEDSN